MKPACSAGLGSNEQAARAPKVLGRTAVNRFDKQPSNRGKSPVSTAEKNECTRKVFVSEAARKEGLPHSHRKKEISQRIYRERPQNVKAKRLEVRETFLRYQKDKRKRNS